jgi:surface polysaccharide O-acyltransferase-like enzyme
VLAWDALRVFAILSVVGIHAFMTLRGTIAPHDPRAVIDDMLHYAVPVFVFISGALVWGRPFPSEPGAYKRFVASRARTIALPYVAWFAIYLALAALTAEQPGRILAHAPVLLVTGNVWYHLYFIPMLLGFYLLTPWASRATRRQPELLVLAAYVIRLALWPQVDDAVRGVSWQAWSYLTHIATHLPHMALGAWFAVRAIAEKPAARRVWPLLLITGQGVLLAATLGVLPRIPVIGSVVTPAAMALSVLGFALAAFALEPAYHRYAAPLTRVAALSFGIYFVHPAWLLALNRVLEATGTRGVWSAWWMPVAVWALLSAASYAVAWALSRSSATSWLVGVR